MQRESAQQPTNSIDIAKHALNDADRVRISEITNNEELEQQQLYKKTVAALNKLYSSANPLTEVYPFLPANFSRSSADMRTLKKIFATLQVRLEKDKEIPPYTRLDIPALRTYMEVPSIKDIKKYIEEVYSVHIPYYEQMFIELDDRRVMNPYMQEVFIGRDAIFMYQARRMQYLLRGKRAPKSSITYVNFPRGFTDTDTVTIEQARQYLTDHGITDVDNAIFIDTGYSGSIPEYIITKVFGMDKVGLGYLDSHILLLEGDVERAVNDIYYPMHRSRVHIIERSPMHEKTASHVYQHRSGKWEAYGDPNSPITRFYYDLLRHIIMRHFYLQELYTQGKLEKQR